MERFAMIPGPRRRVPDRMIATSGEHFGLDEVKS